MACDTSNEVVY